VWAIALSAVVARALIAVATGFTNEDSLITLRHVENLVAGHGLVFNPGERVLGTTTPLYALFLAGVAALGAPALAAGKAANILADGALCLVAYRWLREAGWERAGVWTAFFIAVNPLHARWAVSGMETSLVTLCGVGSLWLLQQGRLRAAYAALAVLFLLRWDSLLLTGVATLWLWRAARTGSRSWPAAFPWRPVGLFVVLVTPWLGYATWFYGSPIPVTARSKMTVYGWRQAGPVPQAHKLGDRLAGNPAYGAATLLALAGVLALRRRARAAREPEAPAFPVSTLGVATAWLGVYWLAWLFSKVLLFEWYVVPPLPVWEALIAIGAEQELGAAARRRPWLLRAAPLVLAVPLAAAGLWRTADLCAENQRVEEVARKPLGLWLRDHAGPGETVMLEPIGYIGYYSRLRVLDVIGLVSPQVLPYWRDQSQAPYLDIARAFRPEWCVLRPSEVERMRAAAAATGRPWETDYELVGEWVYRSADPKRESYAFQVYRRLAGAPPPPRR
jgi:hypothetical protein